MRRIRPEEALLSYGPSEGDPFDLKKAAHLARRAGFGARRDECERMVDAGLDASLRTTIEGKDDGGAFGKLLAGIEGELVDLARTDALQGWWLYRMLHSPDPLGERLTLFWHDHFATSVNKVGQRSFMRRQNDLLRARARGPFGEMLLAISKDPAMLVWLDNRYNVKGRPNENYAREVLELFSLGRDRYSERDIKEVARAFTGWHLRGEKFFFNKAAHDAGEKTIFGQTGKFGGEDVVRLVLERPDCARYLTRKLWTHFVGPWAPPAALDALARSFAEDEHHVGRLVERILRSRAFFSAQAHRSRIAGPVEFLVGTMRRLGTRMSLRTAAQFASGMGQALFAPPTVEGWKEEDGWLSARWNLNRMNAAATLSAQRGRGGESRFDAWAYACEFELDTKEKAVEHFVTLFADGDVPDGVRERLLTYMDHYDARGAPKAEGGKLPLRKSAYEKDWYRVDRKIRGLAHLVLALPEAQVC